MTPIEWAGITAMYVFGVGPWLRWIYVESRKTWQVPLRIAKVGTGRMTSNSDHAGLI